MTPDPRPGDRTELPAAKPKDGRLPSRPATADGKATFYDYLAMLARRKWLAIGLFSGVLVLTVVFIVRTQPVFQARATFMVTPRDAGNVFANGIPIYSSKGTYGANCIELLRSRSMAAKVAARLPDSLKLPAEKLQSMVAARPLRETDVIEIVATGQSKAAAVTAANLYLDTYQEYDLD